MSSEIQKDYFAEPQAPAGAQETLNVRGTITRVVRLIKNVNMKYVDHWSKNEGIGLRSDEGQEIFVLLADLPFDKQWYEERIGKMIDVTVSVREVTLKVAAPEQDALPAPRRALS